jgi:cholesterol oxidase
MLGRVKYNKLNKEDLILEEIAKDMNAHETFESVSVGVNLDAGEEEKDPYFAGLGPLRKGCTECGGCMVGCRENAKNTLDRNYLWFAEKQGLEILPGTKAEKISYNDGVYSIETKNITSFLPQGKRTFKSRGLIIAAGTLGTLELLLKQKHRYGTLPLLSEALGHQLRTNAETLSAVSGAKEKLNNGIAITSVFHPDSHSHVEIVKYPDNSNAMKWFFGLAADGSATAAGRTLKLLWKTIVHPFQFLKTVFNFRWSTRLVILLVMQTVDNAMKMKWKKTLFGGKMKIDNSGQKKVPAYIPVGQDVMKRFASKVNGIPQNILLEILFNRPTTAHILGGCPMSENAETGVIDKNMKVHGYPELYITGGAAIQGNIGVNPALTITAMAEYAMSRIPQKEGSAKTEISKQLTLLEDEWKKKKSI